MLESEVTGIMVYYYYVCKRKLWYYLHEIRMESENQDVKLGKILEKILIQLFFLLQEMKGG